MIVGVRKYVGLILADLMSLKFAKHCHTILFAFQTDYNKGPYNVLQWFRENRWIHTGAVIEAYLGVDQASIMSIVDVLKKVG